MSTLKCSEVSVHRGGVRALTGVGIELATGESVGLIGPNGAGKTTLLDVLSGFMSPASGTVHIDGLDITGLNAEQRARQGIHRTFQGARLYSGLTVEENVVIAALASGMSRREAGAIARDLLLSLELSEISEYRCRGLPQGVVQRVVLARALATRPNFLLLDEPAAGLSEVETEEFEALLARTREDGAGVLVVEHDMPFVERVCQRAYVLAEGALLFAGSVKETFSSSAVQSAYLGDAESLVHVNE